MTKSDSPANIGFVLGRCGVTLPWLGRTYRGVDRRLPFPDPLEIDDNESKLWDEYLEAEDKGELGRDRLKAERLQESFQALGVASEVLYGDIIDNPFGMVTQFDDSDLQRHDKFAWFVSHYADIGPAPSDFVSLGLDVSEPFPSFHSPIIQPGPGFVHDAVFASHLNEFGLIMDDDEQYALDVMNAANDTGYRYSMFCVIRIFVPQSAAALSLPKTPGG